MDAMDALLSVENLCVKLDRATILDNVTFSACNNKVLAIMGPSGSGKTTLLNTLSGRQPMLSGAVTMSGLPFNKHLRRRLGFVLQHDVFFSNLTLWETLYFTAMIQLPDCVSSEEKLRRLNEIIDMLGLRKCANTVIGDLFVRGLSGGEKKRTSIACELLTNPDILLLDEPTSGLDSSTAFALMKSIQQFAVGPNKMVIMSIHQPSSQMYHMFDSLLLLCEGKVAYYGEAHSTPLIHLKNLGYSCEPNYNPADFLMEILKSENKEALLANGHYCQQKENDVEPMKTLKIQTFSNDLARPFHKTEETIVTVEEPEVVAANKRHEQRWPTCFSTQFWFLTWRAYKQSRSRIFHLYDLVHFVVMTGVVGLIFFQIPNTSDVIRDRMGMIFFVLTFWTFDAAFDGILAFPGEREVISKERCAGAYRLSAYYLAKTVSEIPLKAVIPTLFYVTVYFLGGLNGVMEFFVTWAILMLNVFTAQGLGLFIGALFLNTKLAILTGNTVILTSVLCSGYITQAFPWWLTWVRFTSTIYYPYSAMMPMVLRGLEDASCNSTSVTKFPQCLKNETDSVTMPEMLQEAGIALPIHWNILILAAICVILRLLAYVALRFKHVVPR